MICPYCQTQVGENHARFCSNCGKQLEQNSSQSTTPSPSLSFLSSESVFPSSEGQLWQGEQLPIFEQSPLGQVIPKSASSPDQMQPFELFGEGLPPGASSLSPIALSTEMPQHQEAGSPENANTEAALPPPAPLIARPSWRSLLAKPLPWWAWLSAIALLAFILLVLQWRGEDWAAGAMQVGIAAGIVAGITVLALGVRTLAGMRRWKEILSLSLAIVILGVFSGIGMSQQALIHRWQAQYLEGQHNWQPAITQYERSGEGAPASDAIGRVFVEWGEQLSQEQHYEMALARYNVVLGQYFAAKAQVLRAQSDSIKALIQWGKQSMNQKDYVGAATHFDALFNLTYCNSSCQAAASLLDAQAYYQLAEAKFALGQFEDAVNFFRQITTRFSNSPEAQKIHPDFAQALLGQGKLQLTTSCNSAIPTYQELVTSFADTPQGQQAIKEIKAPQLVKGHFASYIPSFPLTPLVALLPKLYANMPAQEFFQLLNTSPKVVVQSDGSFNFQPVKQGTYYLTWGTVSSTGSTSFSFVSNHSSGELIYVAHVGPLCPYDFQTIYQPFSLAP